MKSERKRYRGTEMERERESPTFDIITTGSGGARIPRDYKDNITGGGGGDLFAINFTYVRRREKKRPVSLGG